MPAAPSSPIPAVLAKLGPLPPQAVDRLRVHLAAVPDPRSRRGRWYPLVSVLLICACAVVSGACTIDEITEWGQRASTDLLARLGIRRHLLGRRRAPSHPTIERILARLDGDALDTAIGAYLAERDRTRTGTATPRPSQAIAVDGKALKGSAHLTQRHRHLLSAVPHAPSVTVAQREVDAKSNETAAFELLLAGVDLTGTVVTFDALHSVKEQARWLVQDKKAHYIAVIKGTQPAASAQLRALPWDQVAVAHSVSETGHGRRESRSIKTMAVAASLGGIAFPEAELALRIHRRRKETGRKESRETVYAVTSLDVRQATPAQLSAHARGQLGSGKLQPPRTRPHLRRGSLDRVHRQRTPGDGRTPQPGHRRPAIVGGEQHRQDHPGHPRRSRTSRMGPGHQRHSSPFRNLKKPCDPVEPRTVGRGVGDLHVVRRGPRSDPLAPLRRQVRRVVVADDRNAHVRRVQRARVAAELQELGPVLGLLDVAVEPVLGEVVGGEQVPDAVRSAVGGSPPGSGFRGRGPYPCRRVRPTADRDAAEG